MTPSPSEHEWYVIITVLIASIGFITMIAYYVQQMVVSSKRHPPIEAEFATKKELKELEDKFVGGVTAIQQTLGAHNKSAENRAAKLHKRINKILLATGIIAGRCQALHGAFPPAPIIDEDEDEEEEA